MVDWTSVGVGGLVLGYLAALVYSLVKWDGFRRVIKERAGVLILFILLGMVFLEAGGGYALWMVAAFTVIGAVGLGVFAGPMGFFVGLYLGFFFAIFLLLYSLFT